MSRTYARTTRPGLQPIKINSFDRTASSKIYYHVSCFINNSAHAHRELVFLCLGSDRATGDALGPLVGQQLQACRSFGSMVMGDLQKPVHAKNLEDTIHYLRQNHGNAFIIALDASLGHVDDVGYIEISPDKLKPGKGVHKDLPEIGDISIRGVVNTGGFMEQLVLQSTRLSLVMHMSKIISRGLIKVACRSLYLPPR